MADYPLSLNAAQDDYRVVGIRNGPNPGITLGNTFVGILVGDGVPSATAAKGSLYINRTGGTGATRLYVNTDGAATWSAFTAAA